MGEKANIILFTGQSGIKMNYCLNRIKKELNSEVEIISVENLMEQHSGRNFKKDLLKEHPPYLYNLWHETFEKKVLDSIESNNDTIYFLTFHSIYYHQAKLDYFSPLDFDLIKQIRNKVKFIIVLIDDIYDIYQRLLEPGEMYHEVFTKDPIDAIFESIFNLRNILEWRQIEITISRIIERMLDVKMYLFAVKHPIFLINRMIEFDLNKIEFYYLSHPISQTRREAHSSYQTYPGELKHFIYGLNNYKTKIIFIPTTIDELRIKTEKEGEKEGEKKIYIPDFHPRWPIYFEKGEMINNVFEFELKNPNPLNPKNYNYQDIEIKERKKFKLAISHLLGLLLKSIDNQVTSRDLSMVDKSNYGLIVYRPYSPLKYSKGVLRELKHNLDLYRKGENTRAAYIFTLENELIQARIVSFFDLIIDFIDEKDKSRDKKYLKEKLEVFIESDFWNNIFSNKDDLLKNLKSLREDIDPGLGDYTFSHRLSGVSYGLSKGHIAEHEDNRIAGYEAIIKKIYEDIMEEFLIKKEHYKKFKHPFEINLKEIFNNT